MRHMVLIAVLILMSGGCARPESKPQELLQGSWTSGLVTTEWGIAKINLTFDRATVKVVFEPAIGDPIRVSESYRIDGGAIISDAFNKGEPVAFHVTRNALTVEIPDEGTMTYSRK